MKVRLEVEVDQARLTHLLWDALVTEHRGSSLENTAKFVFYLPDKRVKVLINRRLVACGLNAVSVGPQHPYPSADVEKLLALRVSQAYGF